MAGSGERGLRPLWHAIGRQLRNPAGRAGWLTGIAMRVANRQPTRHAVDALAIAPGDVVLDLGCGGGQAIAAMAALARAGRVHGIDQSGVMLRQAARVNRAAMRNGHVFLDQGDFVRLPYETASFDKILASNVMYFWEDVPTVLTELRRVLRPGGRVAIYVTAAETMRRWKFAATGTHRLFEANDLRGELRAGGFERAALSVRPIMLAGGVQGLLAVLSREP